MNTEREVLMNRLLKFGIGVVALLGVFLIAESLNAFKEWHYPGPNYRTISITGEGEVFAVADIATFTYTVSADAASVTEAQNTVTNKMNAILDAVKGLGVEEKDITTSNYSVYPKYTYKPGVCSSNYCPPGNQVPDGFTVSHDVTIKVRKVDDAGKVLAAVGEKGATNVSGISFTTDDPTALQGEARAKAIEDAKTKAKALADDLDIRLVRIVSYSDNSGNYPMPMYDKLQLTAGEASVRNVAPTLPVGQNKIISNVTVEYEIR